MRKAIFKDLLLIIAGTGFLLALLIIFIPRDKQFNPGNIISVKNEAIVGDKLVKILLESPEYHKFKHPLVDSAIHEIFQRLYHAMDSSLFEYSIHLVDNDHMVNGFAMPGGNMILTTGLIKFCESPDELAAVIAHEMGHVENRHVLSRLSRDVFIMVLTGGDSQALGEVAKNLAARAFDRKQERLADQFALDLMTRAGIHPVALASLFRRLKEEEGTFDKRMEIISTHPHHDKRIKEALMYQVPADFEAIPFPFHWEDVRNFDSKNSHDPNMDFDTKGYSGKYK